MPTRLLRSSALLFAAALLPQALPAQQQQPPERDDVDVDISDIIVTARVRQGGAQDISHFRSIAADVGMPRPEALSVEGLLGEYDLTLPASRACAQLFCLVTEASAAALPSRPDDRLFVGLGFTSNIDAATWHRAPLDLIAVVDKSGSMDGTPLARVRASLRQIVGQMHAGDRLGIVLYGDTAAVYLEPTDIAGGRGAVLAAIDRIASAGSTDMESGLKVGYATAFAEAAAFRGNVRMMLFTDEQPNVGRTDADSFMTMAEQASRRGIGLTTIGVGVQFDDTLANRIASVRGGNMFFVADDKDVATVFEKNLDSMVSELAHDLRLTLRPAAGYRISGVFGVPDNAMAATPEGTIDVTIPTVFLSANGGGIFATLAKAGDRADLPAAPLADGTPLMTVSLAYNRAADGVAGGDEARVGAPTARPSLQLTQAHMLVDEYLSLREATTAFHLRGDPKAAFATLQGLSSRIDGGPLAAAEKKLVGSMLEQAGFYAGYAGEAPKTLRHLAVVGKWEVVAANGFTDLHRGDRLEFTSDRAMLTYRKQAGLQTADETEDYEINEKAIHLVDSELVLSYSARGDRMSLRTDDVDSEASLALRRLY